MILERHVTIVGESPPSSNPNLPPLGGVIGRRLRALAGIESDQTMRALFDCVNLFETPQGRWSVDAAHVRATTIGVCCQSSLLLMLGPRVGAAFYMRPFDHRSLPGILPGFNRRILGIVLPKLSLQKLSLQKLSSLKDDVLTARTTHYLKHAVRVARGTPLSYLMCEVHGEERVHAPEIREERRVYCCGCEVLT